MRQWPIDSSDAGWITGAFYLSYVLAVPLLVTLTDRVDPRRIYLFGVSLTVLAHAGFAFAAEGFWSATALRAIAGIGWAGTYMTGLKLLADRVSARQMSRAVSGHAASVGLAGGLSFAFAGTLADVLAPSGAFMVAAIGASGALAIAFFCIAPRIAPRTDHPIGKLLDFRPVLRNRPAMAYAAAYCVHTWEMSALRGWGVVFLTWVAAQTGDETHGWLAPVMVVTVMALMGTGSSVIGNELAIRFGRIRIVRTAMVLGIFIALGFGWVGSFDYQVATLVVVTYGIVIWLDSSALTAGTAGNAEPERRGATLAVHSMLGYAGGFVGPVVIGIILNASGGQSHIGWWLAFAHLALIGLIGRLVFDWLGPRELKEEQK
jgi:MFS family permease